MNPVQNTLRMAVRGLIVICLGSAASAGPVADAPSLTPHKAQYDVKISVLGGTLTSEVTAAGSGFMANSVIEPTGMSRIVARGAIQESSFFLTDIDGVQPAQYRSIDTLSSDNQTVNLDFDWRENAVNGSVNDVEFQWELEGRVHDRVSIQYELMLDLLQGQTSSRYSLLDGDELKILEVRNIGERQVKTPYGTFQATGIQHNKENSSRITTLWCARELGFLPVVIEQHRGGKLRVRAVLTDYQVTEPVTTVPGS